MKDEINICYIDDNLDPNLSIFLDNYSNSDHEVNITEYTCSPEDTYQTLLSAPKITKAAVILIDSQLFESSTISKNKLTGEHFLIILKKVLPFIKTIIITQNEIKHKEHTLQKYRYINRDKETYNDYYSRELMPLLNSLIKEFVEEKSILKEMESEEEFDPLLLETLQKTIDGLDETTIFRKEELDELISLFKDVKGNYGNS